MYIGRLGLTDSAGRRLLVDWRSPAAEPFFGATHAQPMGLASRRRYRWTRGRVTDYWDEVFTPDGLEGHAALDDQSAFIASLGSSRSGRMRDVLGTIQADQDAIIRAGSRGTLVVDGGPGTGKTVVALHRAAYLLYADPRLGAGRGGVLFVGPHRPYLAYVADVLPSLGEEGVRTCTLRDLVPEGATAGEETDPEVARLKATAEMVTAIEPAVRLYEEPPTEGMEVETPWGDVWLSVDDWAEAFEAPDPGTPHNEARDQVWEELVTILADKLGRRGGLGRPAAQVAWSATTSWSARSAGRGRCSRPPTSSATSGRCRRTCAGALPGSARTRSARCSGADPQAWTVADLPLLDAARQRLGDPEASRRRRRQEAALAAEREEMSRVVDHLIATDDSDLQVMSMLRGDDLRETLVDESAVPTADPDVLAGPFAHIVVDEAQELTDAEWQMLLLRCPQPQPHRRRRPGPGPARVRGVVAGTARAGRPRPRHPGVADHQLPDAGRGDGRGRAGHPRRAPGRQRADLDPPHRRARRPRVRPPTSTRSWTPGSPRTPTGSRASSGCRRSRARPASGRWRPELSKGLEFDLVVLVDPDDFGDGIEGAVDRYVAMTRATQQLVVLRSP